MRAIYLQSVRSPAGGGRFKLTSERDVINDVYSQAPRDSEQDESYEEDSFCVNTSQINQSGATITAYYTCAFYRPQNVFSLESKPHRHSESCEYLNFTRYVACLQNSWMILRLWKLPTFYLRKESGRREIPTKRCCGKARRMAGSGSGACAERAAARATRARGSSRNKRCQYPIQVCNAVVYRLVELVLRNKHAQSCRCSRCYLCDVVSNV